MEISILFETNQFLVVSKPAGLLVHGDGKREEKTLVNWITEKYPEIVGVGEPLLVDGKTIDRPGIVHRLDEETSGALVIAKTQEAFLFLKEQFQNRTVKKEYHAFVWGMFKESSGVVAIPIGRNKNDFRRWHAGRGTRGELREAITEWHVKGIVEENEEGKVENFSFMHLYPKTGRTHQLRVHMKYLQHPIVSDDLYAESKSHALGFTRTALHSRKLSFHDMSGNEISVEAPYPSDFEAALAKTAFR